MSAGNGNGNGKKGRVWHIFNFYSHATAEKVNKWIDGWKLEPPLFATAWLLLLVMFAAAIDQDGLEGTLAAITLLSPVWLPLYLGTILWIVWIHYVRFLFWFGDKKIVLEIQLPPEIEKSPLAMEVVFNGIWNNGGETTFIDRFWRGKFRPVWSFEIASNEGRINYYIHTRAAWKDFIETRIYGQFPEARVTVVPDYVSHVNFNLEEYDLWGTEYKKTQAQAAPIKTYYSYDLDKNTDVPEIKVDPLTNIFEIMNNMGKDQYMWLQFIVKARKYDEWYGIYKNTDPKGKTDTYKVEARQAIKDVIAEAAERARDIARDTIGLKDEQLAQAAGRGMNMLTEEERAKVEAIDKQMDKPVFESGVRMIYISKRDKFFGLTGAVGFRFFESFRSDFNELRGGRHLVGNFDYPWEDFHEIRKNMVKRNLFFFFKHRAYFYVPYEQAPVMLTTEEMASLWHFPGSAVRTPGLDRVPSRRAEAPSNLPIRTE